MSPPPVSVAPSGKRLLMPCGFPNTPPPSWLRCRYYVYGVLGNPHRVAFIKPLRGTMIATFRSLVGAPAPTPPLYKCVTFYQVRDNQISVAPALHSVAVVAFSRHGDRPRSCVCMSVARSLALAPCGVGMAPVVAIHTPHRLQTHSLCVPSWLLRAPSLLRYVPPLLRGGSRPHTPAPGA